MAELLHGLVPDVEVEHEEIDFVQNTTSQPSTTVPFITPPPTTPAPPPPSQPNIVSLIQTKLQNLNRRNMEENQKLQNELNNTRLELNSTKIQLIEMNSHLTRKVEEVSLLNHNLENSAKALKSFEKRK